MARQSHRPWLLRLGGFLGLILIAHVSAQWMKLGYWQPLIHNQTMKIHLYQRDGLAPDLLFLGTSKTNRAVIPVMVEQGLATAFCLGQPGMSMQAQAMVLRDVLETNPGPRLVVLEVTPIALNANHGRFNDVLRFYASPGDLVRTLPRLRSAARWRAAGQGLFRGMTSLYLLAWRCVLGGGQDRQLASIRRLKGGHYGPTLPKTIQRLSEMAVEDQQDLIRTMRVEGRRMYMRNFTIGGEPAEGLENIIRLTRIRGLGLVLFNPPVTQDYRRALYRSGEYERYAGYVEEICLRERIPFINLDDGRLDLTSADFHDFGHLNAAGAVKVSRLLTCEVLPPLLESPPVPTPDVAD
jgi:hypothetical protein